MVDRKCHCNLFGMEHKRQAACDVFEQITMPEIQLKICKRKKKRGKK
jgi:hypothetical protein